jgi:hypothetical protein
MTVDELLSKLDAEYDRLESELPAHFLEYGRFKYSYPTDTRYHYSKAEIDRILKRQKEIRDSQIQIRKEKDRVTA